MYPQSNISIIVEVLQSVEPTDLKDVAKYAPIPSPAICACVDRLSRFHFDSLAHDNSAKTSESHEVTVLQNGQGHSTPSPVVLYGTQTVRKFNRQTADEIRILLAVYRISDHNIDLVVTMNVPMKAEDSGATTEEEWNAAKASFFVAAESLRIVDFGLFA